MQYMKGLFSKQDRNGFILNSYFATLGPIPVEIIFEPWTDLISTYFISIKTYGMISKKSQKNCFGLITKTNLWYTL